MSTDEPDLDALEQCCPEQMRRDPTGALARATMAAADSAAEVEVAPVSYLHLPRCRGLVAVAGYTPAGPPTFVGFRTSYRPAQGELRPDGTEVRTTRSGSTVTRAVGLAPGGAAAKGRGIEWPDGVVALLVEPAGFPPPPPTLPGWCRRCGARFDLDRNIILTHVRESVDGPPRRVAVSSALANGDYSVVS